jgi:hypothetical protein
MSLESREIICSLMSRTAHPGPVRPRKCRAASFITAFDLRSGQLQDVNGYGCFFTLSGPKFLRQMV